MPATIPTTIGLAITGMSCEHCVSRITRTLSGIPGLQVVDVSVGAANVRVTEPTALDRAIADLADLGYTATLPGKAATACQCCK